MGVTPLEGLVMGTRSGDVDPSLHAHLHRQLGWSLEEIDGHLNRDSGLKGLTGQGDFRELEARMAAGDPAAQLAFAVCCHRLRKYVGAYYAVLGRVDAIAFTGGEARRISPADGEVAVLVVPTDEEWQIAREAQALLDG
jgi:acetate kinase